jgi:Ca-activated chloride channel family protein
VDISNRTKTTKGIDIVMAVDVSGSMLARFEAQPNGGIKRVAADFVQERPNDRMDLSFTLLKPIPRPVTSDKAIVEKQ